MNITLSSYTKLINDLLRKVSQVSTKDNCFFFLGKNWFGNDGSQNTFFLTSNI